MVYSSLLQTTQSVLTEAVDCCEKLLWYHQAGVCGCCV